jgi:hypothetical protein
MKIIKNCDKMMHTSHTPTCFKLSGQLYTQRFVHQQQRPSGLTFLKLD